MGHGRTSTPMDVMHLRGVCARSQRAFEWPVPGVCGMQLDRLKEMCRVGGLPRSGKKAELATRVTQLAGESEGRFVPAWALLCSVVFCAYSSQCLERADSAAATDG